ncbi:MAG TPA: DinB family protein [Bryobacteraceae bacterium]|jgi:uncharacterized damage-inducible protein DinB
MTSQEARTHIRYTGWASRRLLDAVAELSEEQRSKGMQVSHDSIQGTLGHIHFADRIWYSRTVERITLPPMAEMCTWEALNGDWPALQKRWETYAESLTDADMERTVAYKYLDGTPGSTPLSQVILHLVNHATLHRGQVMATLRQVGVKPPGTDFISYLREQAAAQAAG